MNRNACSFLLMIIVWISTFTVESVEKTILRVGHFSNITHPQAIIGHGLTREGKGWFERYLGPNVEIEWYVYSAGPSAMEAVFAKSLDLVYVGPSPTINAYFKSKGNEVRVVCGACSGGCALVVRPGLIKEVSDFKDKTIATPQLGNTQDVAARSWFRSQGFVVKLFGGDLRIIPMENVDQLTLFQQGDLDGAWTVEPWVSRLLLEAKGEIYFEESKLWPETGGKYTTTHLVSRRAFLDEKSEIVKKWILAHVELTEWIEANQDEAKKIFNQEIAKEVFQPFSLPILERAWSKLELTYAPLRASVVRFANEAFEIGLIKERPDLSQLYDLRLLFEILDERETQENNDAKQ